MSMHIIIIIIIVSTGNSNGEIRTFDRQSGKLGSISIDPVRAGVIDCLTSCSAVTSMRAASNSLKVVYF